MSKQERFYHDWRIGPTDWLDRVAMAGSLVLTTITLEPIHAVIALVFIARVQLADVRRNRVWSTDDLDKRIADVLHASGYNRRQIVKPLVAAGWDEKAVIHAVRRASNIRLDARAALRENENNAGLAADELVHLLWSRRQATRAIREEIRNQHAADKGME